MSGAKDGGGKGGGGGRLPPRNPLEPEDPSSSDDSSDDDDDSNDFFVRPLPKKSKKARKPKDFSPTPFPQSKIIRITSAPTISMNKPERFSGKDKAKFKSWWLSAKAYMNVYEASFDSDQAKIAWIGSVFSDVALEWHQQRAT